MRTWTLSCAIVLTTLSAQAQPALKAKIISTGATHYEIDLDVVAQAMLEGLTKHVRANKVAGGFALSGIQPGSLFARLGLFNGDRVTAVGTIAAGDERGDWLRSAYGEATRLGKATVTLLRKGRPLELHYKLRRLTPRLPRSRTLKREALAAELEKGITKKSEHHYRLKRSAFEKLVSSPETLARQARIIPAHSRGSGAGGAGIKIYGIRRRSAFALLGLKNGDQVHSINNVQLKGPEEALDLYQSIKGSKRLEVRITRRGKPLELVIELVP